MGNLDADKDRPAPTVGGHQGPVRISRSSQDQCTPAARGPQNRPLSQIGRFRFNMPWWTAVKRRKLGGHFCYKPGHRSRRR